MTDKVFDIDERIVEVTNLAEAAFWAVVAEKFPEAASGDLDPGAAMQFSEAAGAAVEAWVEANFGGV